MTRFLTLLLALSATANAAKTLDMYFIDVEGGQATLIVPPSGQAMLVDTGYAGNSGRDADRIAAAAKAAGVKRIDTLLITHHHNDHVGGVANLLERLPVATFLDKGSDVEDGHYPEPYEKAFAGGHHKTIAAGDKIPVKGLDVTVMTAAGKVIARKAMRIPIAPGWLRVKASLGKIRNRRACWSPSENSASLIQVTSYGTRNWHSNAPRTRLVE